MGTDLTAQLHPIAIPEQLWDRGTHLEVATASLMGSALGIFAIFLYKHVGAKAYVAEISHSCHLRMNETLAIRSDLDFRFQDLGF